MDAILAAGLLLAWGPALPGDEEDPSDGESLWFERTNVGYGPFNTVTLSPLSSLRPGFAPVVPTSLAAGGFEAGADQSWEKVISESSRWLFDYEVVRTNVAFGWEPVDLWRLECALDATERAGGGALQHLMLAFHRAFGLKTSYITPYPADENRIEIASGPGRGPIALGGSDPQPAESSGRVTLERGLTYGDETLPAASAALSIGRKLSPGDLRGGLPVDVAGSLGASKAAGSFFFYAAADLEWFGLESFYGLPLRATQWSARVAVEWHCLPAFSVTAQYLLKRGAPSRLENMSLPSNDLTGGVAWEVSPGARLELALIHDVLNPYSAPDYGFHLGLAVRW